MSLSPVLCFAHFSRYLVDGKKCSANVTDSDGDTPLKVGILWLCDKIDVCRLPQERHVLLI